MTRSAPLLTRVLPLAALLALATTAAHAAGNPPVFYCDAKTMADRQAEIFTIRQDILPSLKAVMDDPGAGDDRISTTEQYAEYSAQLEELLLGVRSCKELRDFERYGEAGPPKKPIQEDDLLAPPPSKKKGKAPPPKKPPTGSTPPPPEDDLLAPPPSKTPKAPPPADDGEPALVRDYLEASTEIMEAEVARMKAEGASQELIDDFVEASAEAAIEEAARMRAELQDSPS